jgi:hypothetical protein
VADNLPSYTIYTCPTLFICGEALTCGYYSSFCPSLFPVVTISVWPNGRVCHAVREPGSNVTLAPTARLGSFAWNRGSMRTAPVKYSPDPLVEGCEPIRLFGFERYLYYLLQCCLMNVSANEIC